MNLMHKNLWVLVKGQELGLEYPEQLSNWLKARES